MVHLLSRKSGINFTQNCDFPPPSKVSSGFDKMVMSSINEICGKKGREGEERYNFEAWRTGEISAMNPPRKHCTDCPSPFRNLPFSSPPLLRQSQHLQKLQKTVGHLLSYCHGCEQGDDVGKDGAEVSLLLALALCLVINGVGLAFGCKFLLNISFCLLIIHL